MSSTSLDDAPLGVLQSTFGYERFRSGQREVIDHLLAGQSALAIFPTGGGKSLCYQIPALLLDGVTIVISPLIALMKDQIDMLTARGVRAARLDSTQDAVTVRQIYDDLRAQRLRLLYVAPERLGSERFVTLLRELRVALLAVDEAHCISEWGHNFRPDYLKLAALARELRIPRLLGLTATATPAVAESIARAFDIEAGCVVNTGFYRPNLTLHVSSAKNRTRALLQRLQSRSPGSTIVYVTLQRTAERVAGDLSAAGLPSRSYHPGLEDVERHAIQDWFMQASDAIVVATIAFGMGIDKSNIRYVYHYNLPKSLENYAQEIGRAGRDGQPAVCELFAGAEDVVVLENFTYGDTPDAEAVELLVGRIAEQGPTFDVSVHELSHDCDMRPLVIETALTYLELDGLLRATGPFYTEYKFQWLQPSDEVFAGFDAARVKFLTTMFGHTKVGRTWSHLDLHAAAVAMGEPRDRLLRAIGYLEEKGWITLRASGVRQGFRRLVPRLDKAAVTGTLNERFARREAADIDRLGMVLKQCEATSCYTQALWGYFGEARAACGHCGVCLGEPTVRLAGRDGDAGAMRSQVEHWHGKMPESAALRTPRQRARFLCGLKSPQTSRARLGGHASFGALADISFRDVLAWLT